MANRCSILFDVAGGVSGERDLTPDSRPDLRAVIDRIRPTVLAGERTLPVTEPLQPLCPLGGLARGSRVSVRGTGAASLAMHLASAASAAGSWTAIVGVGSWGWAAAARAGWSLERSVMIAEPPTSQWGTVVAALLEAVEIVVVDPTHQVTASDARRLTARSREQGAVIVDLAVADGRRRYRWPTDADLVLTAATVDWEGLADGHGLLTDRRLQVSAGGRRGAARATTVDLVVGAAGWLAAATPATEPVPMTQHSSATRRHLRSVG